MRTDLRIKTKVGVVVGKTEPGSVGVTGGGQKGGGAKPISVGVPMVAGREGQQGRRIRKQMASLSRLQGTNCAQ